jgi:hypothetical protein
MTDRFLAELEWRKEFARECRKEMERLHAVADLFEARGDVDRARQARRNAAWTLDLLVRETSRN